MQHFQYSRAGLALTKQFEGLRLHAYQDAGGIWTVGYGHTGPLWPSGTPVHAGLVLTEPEAEALLLHDLAASVECVNTLVIPPLAQHQFDALVDFAFNTGCGSFRRSTLLRLVNAGDFASAANEFSKWVDVAGKPLPGLIRRRAAEATMFRDDQTAPTSKTHCHFLRPQ